MTATTSAAKFANICRPSAALGLARLALAKFGAECLLLKRKDRLGDCVSLLAQLSPSVLAASIGQSSCGEVGTAHKTSFRLGRLRSRPNPPRRPKDTVRSPRGVHRAHTCRTRATRKDRPFGIRRKRAPIRGSHPQRTSHTSFFRCPGFTFKRPKSWCAGPPLAGFGAFSAVSPEFLPQIIGRSSCNGSAAKIDSVRHSTRSAEQREPCRPLRAAIRMPRILGYRRALFTSSFSGTKRSSFEIYLRGSVLALDEPIVSPRMFSGPLSPAIAARPLLGQKLVYLSLANC